MTMKTFDRLLFSLLVFVWAALTAPANPLLLLTGAGESGAPSYTEIEGFGTPNTGVYTLGGASGRLYLANYYAAGSTNNIDRFRGWIERVGSPAFNVRMALWSSTGTGNSTQPNAELAATAWIAASTIATGTAAVDTLFSDPGVQQTSSTAYWVVYQVSAVGDASNCLRISSTSDGYSFAFSNQIMESANGSAWTDTGNQNLIWHSDTLD